MLHGVAAACFVVALSARPEMPLHDAVVTASVEKEMDPNAWLTKHPVILKMMELENQERARYGLPPLRLNPQMCLAAQQHARWMAETGYYTHSNLGWPEIIHAGPRTPEDAVNGWIYSPAHHGIMLSGSEAGFGYAVNGGVGYWVTVIQ
jgi:hypothetical protein